MRARVVALAAVLSLAGAGTGGATTLPSITVHVKVTLTGGKIVLSRPSAARGYNVEFAVRNGTAHRRTFSVGGKRIAVPAQRTRLTAVQFQARGKYAIVSRGPLSVAHGTFRVS
jgi:hypothetical protein